MKKIYICHTFYHVLITLMKEIKNKNQDSDILLSDSIPNYKELGKNIEESNIMKNIYYIKV